MLEALAVRVAEAHAEAAADDHRLDVEQVDRGGNAGAERLDRALDQPHRHRVLAHERARPDAARRAGRGRASP